MYNVYWALISSARTIRAHLRGLNEPREREREEGKGGVPLVTRVISVETSSLGFSFGGI